MSSGEVITLPVKALSIRQPWAEMIVRGFKNIENRTWPTSFRGMVAIHAGRKVDEYAIGLLRRRGYAVADAKDQRTGGIVGVAKIVDCVEAGDGDPFADWYPDYVGESEYVKSEWFEGPYGFVLEGARAIELIPCPGRLSFFDWRKANAKANRGKR